MSAAPLVDFVVSTHNNSPIIEATLDAIGRQTLRAFTCTVVDGCSTDGTPDLVRSRYSWVRVVEKTADTGPTDSRNIGFRGGSAPYVVLVDSDVELEPQWAERQVELMEADERIAIAGGKVLNAERPELLYSAHGVMTHYGVAWDGGRAQTSHEFDRLRDCLWMNSSALAIRRTAFEAVGGFDTVMAWGFEDADLGWRANLLGWRVVFNPAAEAMHHIHGTFGLSAVGPNHVFFIWRNRLRSMLVNYGMGSLLRYGSVYFVLSVVDGCVRPPRTPKLRAIGWNLRHIRDTLSRRRWVQGRRRISDAELRPMFRRGYRGPGYAFEPRSAAYFETPSSI